MFRIVFFGILTLCWLVFILFLSHQNGEKTRNTSMQITRLVAPSGAELDCSDFIVRKLAHFGCYFILTGLAALAYSSFLMPYCCIIVALLDEATKDLVPGRHCQFIDICVNIVGVLCGCVFLLF